MTETVRDPRTAVALVRHWRLPADPDRVSAVRQELHEQCAAWRIDDQATADVALVADELLANAVRHGRGPLLLTVRAGTTHVYVGVLDRARDTPAEQFRAALLSESGRGLAIVEALSTAWGSEPQAASSKLVWATVPSRMQTD